MFWALRKWEVAKAGSGRSDGRAAGQRRRRRRLSAGCAAGEGATEPRWGGGAPRRTPRSRCPRHRPVIPETREETRERGKGGGRKGKKKRGGVAFKSLPPAPRRLHSSLHSTSPPEPPVSPSPAHSRSRPACHFRPLAAFFRGWVFFSLRVRLSGGGRSSWGGGRDGRDRMAVNPRGAGEGPPAVPAPAWMRRGAGRVPGRRGSRRLGSAWLGSAGRGAPSAPSRAPRRRVPAAAGSAGRSPGGAARPGPPGACLPWTAAAERLPSGTGRGGAGRTPPAARPA